MSSNTFKFKKIEKSKVHFSIMIKNVLRARDEVGILFLCPLSREWSAAGIGLSTTG